MGHTFWRGILAFLLVGVIWLSPGCSEDPYQRSLPSASPTQAQISELEVGLAPEDRELFRRWAGRMATNRRLPGEEPAITVKVALLYQKRFEDDEARKRAELAKQIAAAQAAQDKEDQLAALAKREQDLKAAASERIGTIARVEIESYEFSPVYGIRGIEIGREWIFHLRVSNSSETSITGLRGQLRLSDVFNENSYAAAGQINVTVQPQSAVRYNVSILHDERNRLFQAMRAGSRINYEWVIYSIAFGDGTSFDYSQLARDQ